MKRSAVVAIAGGSAAVLGLLLAGLAALPALDGGRLFTLCLTADSPAPPGGLWSAWSLAPAVAIPLAALVCGYAAHAAGRRRPKDVGLFAVGFLLLAIAVVSPLCRLAANLASAHMVQHVILVAIAPALLVLGCGLRPTGAAPPAASSPRLRLLFHPVGAAVAYGVMIWLWHVPRLYEAALVDGRVHLLMYGSLIAASLAFWAGILGGSAGGAERRIWAVPALLATLLHTGMLGALLTFSSEVWFPLMSAGAILWGLTPLEDQQLAELIMWVPMGMIYLAAALWVIGIALMDLEAAGGRPG